jgi:hypothetical protein
LRSDCGFGVEMDEGEELDFVVEQCLDLGHTDYKVEHVHHLQGPLFGSDCLPVVNQMRVEFATRLVLLCLR